MLWDPKKKRAFVSKDVVFDEDSMLQAKSNMEDNVKGRASDSSANSQREEFEFSDDSNRPVGSDEDSSVSGGDRQEATQEQKVQSRPLRRSDRVSVPSIRYGWEENQVSFALVTKVGDPSSYKEVTGADDSDKWVIVIEKEMECLERNQTWDLVNLLKDSKAIGCMWVFRKDIEQ